VRDLFKKAKENPAIFIDEIDAVGRQRVTGIGVTKTRELSSRKMDGFEGNAGVIIIAATNRPDVLDSLYCDPDALIGSDGRCTGSQRAANLKVHAGTKLESVCH